MVFRVCIATIAAGTVALAPAVPAGADNQGHHKHLVLARGSHAPRNPAASPAPTATPSPTAAGPLVYGGAMVLTAPAVYVVFWGSEWQSGFTTGGYTSAQAEAYVRDFFSDVPGTPWLGATGEYCDGAPGLATTCPANANFIGNPPGQFRGSWTDPGTVPTTPVDADISAEAARAYTHFNSDANAVYFVLTPPGKSESGFGSTFCGWHAFDSGSALPAPYAYLPYEPDAGQHCGMNNVNPVNDAYGHGYFDAFSIIGGHEYQEAITDPVPTGAWADAQGDENADKCEWNSAVPAVNITAGAQFFAVPSVWSNAAGGCVLAQPAPALTPTPTPAPAPTPTPTPTATPTPTPTPTPTATPTATPSTSPAPTPSPTLNPKTTLAGSDPYVLDGFGGIHPAGSAVAVGISAYWPGWDIARSLSTLPGGGGGYVLDGFGGVHPFGSAVPVGVSAYWPGWDIARGIAVAPWSSSRAPQGWVLDGYGGIHPFGGAPSIQPGGYWPGQDIAHGIVIGPTSTPSAVWGYTLDAYGGVHPFGAAAPVNNATYWPGWDIARGIQLLPSSTPTSPAGYTLDGFGGVHAFGSAPPVAVSGYWPGWDIARSLALSTTSGAGGWVLDGFGGLHQFGSAPSIGVSAYWGGWDIAHATAGGGEGSAYSR